MEMLSEVLKTHEFEVARRASRDAFFMAKFPRSQSKYDSAMDMSSLGVGGVRGTLMSFNEA